MVKPTTPAPPAYVKLGVTASEIVANLRVVDAGSGEPILKVIEADAEAGKVVRYAVENGNFVRDGDAFKVITEDRQIRIEWLAPPAGGDEADEEAEA